MKPENLNGNMTKNMRELTLDELEEVSGSNTFATVTAAAEVGGLMVAAANYEAPLATTIKTVASHYSN